MAKDIYGVDWEERVQALLASHPSQTQPDLKAYIQFKRTQAVKSLRLAKVLSILKTFMTRQKIRDLAGASEPQIQAFFTDLEGMGRSEETKRDYAKILTAFFRWKQGLDPGVWPQQTKFLQTYRFKRIARKGQKWSREKVADIIDAGFDLRRKALYTAEFYGGAFRIGEILPLQDRDVSVVSKERGEYRFYVNGKTGEGEPLVFDKFGYIAQWEAERKRQGVSSEGYFWAPLNKPYKMPSYRTEMKAFKNTCERAKVEGKRIFHWFRKSRISDISAQNGPGPMSAKYCRVSQQVMEKHYDLNNAQTADPIMRRIEYNSADDLARAGFGVFETTEGINRAKLVDDVARQMAEKYSDMIFDRIIQNRERVDAIVQQEIGTSLTQAPDGIFDSRYISRKQLISLLVRNELQARQERKKQLPLSQWQGRSR